MHAGLEEMTHIFAKLEEHYYFYEEQQDFAGSPCILAAWSDDVSIETCAREQKSEDTYIRPHCVAWQT